MPSEMNKRLVTPIFKKVDKSHPANYRGLTILHVIDKGYFSEAFFFKPRGGRSPPSGLNRKPRKNPLFSL